MAKSSLSTLLPELLHMVLDEIQARDDLLSLALTCSTFKTLVIPNRFDYHTISTSVHYPALWDHLTSRPDLARNVRELVLCDDYTSVLSSSPRWRLPSALGDGPGPAVTSGKIGDVDSEQLAGAFRLMSLVRRVYIRLSRSEETVPYLLDSAIPRPDIVALIASHLPSLTDFNLVESALNMENSISVDPDYPLWKLSHLRSISLDFNLWKSDLWLPFFSVLHRSPEIEELHVPAFVTYNVDAFDAFTRCHLPSLKRLYIISSLSISAQNMFFFLKAHPTIETLSWFAFDGYPIPHAILPSLKHLLNCGSTTFSMLLHNSPEASVPLESIEDVGLDSCLLPVFDRINPATFRRLSIHHLDRFATLQTLAVRFPTLAEIELPRRGPWDDNHRFFTRLKKALLRPWIEDLSMPHIDDVLELFPRAEVVKGVRCTGLSYGQSREDPKVTRVLGALKARYPRLRRVNTWRLL